MNLDVNKKFEFDIYIYYSTNLKIISAIAIRVYSKNPKTISKTENLKYCPVHR